MECIICYLNTEQEFYTTTCNHTFHYDCLEKWLRHSKNHDCPYCRKRLDPIDRYLLKNLNIGIDWVQKIALYQDKLISGSHLDKIQIWNLNTYECIKTLEIPGQSVLDLKVYQDKLISASYLDTSLDNYHFILWDLNTFEEIKSFVIAREKYSFKFNMKIWNDTLFCIFEKSVEYYSLKTFKQINGFSCAFGGCVFYKNQVIADFDNGKILMWNPLNLMNLNEINISQLYDIRSMLVYEDKLYINSMRSKDESEIIVWDLVQSKIIIRWLKSSKIDFIKIHSSNLFAFGRQSIKMWDLNNFKLIQTINTDSIVSCVKFYQNKLIVGFEDGQILMYNVNKELSKFTLFFNHEKAITCLKIFNNTLISTSIDKTIKIWKLV